MARAIGPQSYGAQITSDDANPPGATGDTPDVPAVHSAGDAPATGWFGKERVVADERSVRRGAWLLAGLLSIGAAVWMRSASRLFSPREDVCAGCAPDWFRWTQLVLALVGTGLALVAVAYLVNIARTGRTWIKRREVTTALAVVTTAWIVVVLGGRLFL